MVSAAAGVNKEYSYEQYLLNQQIGPNGQVVYDVHGPGVRLDDVSEAEANAAMAQLGLDVLFSGDQVIIGGVVATPYDVSVVSQGDIVLPDVPADARVAVDSFTPWFARPNFISDSSILFMALAALREKDSKLYEIARDGAIGAAETKQAAFEAEIGAALAKIEEQKDAAMEQLAWSLVGSAIQIAGAGLSMGGAAGDTSGAWTAIGSATNQVVTSAGQAWAVTEGSQANANKLEIEERRHQQAAEMAQTMIELFQNLAEEAKKGVEEALALLKQHMELEAQRNKAGA